MTMFTRRQVEENLRAKNKELEDRLNAVIAWRHKWTDDPTNMPFAPMTELDEILGIEE